MLLWMGFMAKVNGQDAKAEKLLVKGHSEEGIARYKKIIKKTDNNAPSCVRLSQLLAAKGQYRDAAFYLGQAIQQGDSTPPRIFAFGKLLLQSGNFADADKWLKNYEARVGDTLLTAPLKPQIRAGLELLSRPAGFSVAHVPQLSSKYSEIGAAPVLGGVVITTNRRRGFFVRYTTGKGNRFYDLYLAPEKPDHTLSEPRLMEGRVNFRYHDGPATFSDGEYTIWVTRSNISTGKKRSTAGDTKLRIQYQTKKNAYRWGKRMDLPFASREYTLAHPSLSADGLTLFFASDMPGGYGGFDLYTSQKMEGEWQKPTNLGPGVNTAANEAFPTIFGQYGLYFASDRAGGLGGLDIYQVSKTGESWGGATNVGLPANSPFDDFGMQFIPQRPEGYFVSNRPGGSGSDDIYRFKKFTSIQGTIVNAETGNPIPFAKVEIMDLREQYHSYQTDSFGRFSHFVGTGQDAFIRAEASGYLENRTAVSVRGIPAGEDKQVTLRLQPDIQSAVVVDALDKETQQPLEGVKMEWLGTGRNVSTGPDGKGKMLIEPGRDLTLVISKPGYLPQIKRIGAISPNAKKWVQLPIQMEKGEAIWLKGQVLEDSTQRPVTGSSIRVLDLNTQEIAAVLLPTDSKGQFFGPIPWGQNLNVLALQDGYLTHRQEVFADSLQSDTVRMNFVLQRVHPGQVVRTVYYGYNEADLSRTAQRDLDEIAQFLKANPDLKVELVSHTDCRGNASFNSELSDRRASAAVEYLYLNGIPRERMTFKGMGESDIKNGCTDGKTCEEEQHAENRRTDVVVRGL